MSGKVLSFHQIKKRAFQKYKKEKRISHIKGVMLMAKKASKIYDLDRKQMAIIALLHDYYKHEPIKDLIEIINDPTIISEYAEYPEFYHAFASREAATSEFGITDEVILTGIAYHVSGHLGMDKSVKVIVLADYTEMNHDFLGVKEVRELFLSKELDKALCAYFSNLKKYLHKKNKQIMPKQRLIWQEIKEIIK